MFENNYVSATEMRYSLLCGMNCLIYISYIIHLSIYINSRTPISFFDSLLQCLCDFYAISQSIQFYEVLPIKLSSMKTTFSFTIFVYKFDQPDKFSIVFHYWTVLMSYILSNNNQQMFVHATTCICFNFIFAVPFRAYLTSFDGGFMF